MANITEANLKALLLTVKEFTDIGDILGIAGSAGIDTAKPEVQRLMTIERAAKTLVHWCENAESRADGVKMLAALEELKALFK